MGTKGRFQTREVLGKHRDGVREVDNSTFGRVGRLRVSWSASDAIAVNTILQHPVSARLWRCFSSPKQKRSR